MTALVPADHPPRRGDRANPHSGDCTGTRCPVCDCCMHCEADDNHECLTCAGCLDVDCECPPPAVLRTGGDR